MDIKLEGISKVYGRGRSETAAVIDVNLKIASGELFFLLGPSGCGKTTLLRIMAGLLGLTSGKVLFADRDVTDLPAEKRNAAMVFQNYALWPHMTIAENVEFGPKMQGIGRTRRRSIAADQLDRVQMTEYTARRPNQLSGGQQQRVALARALAAGADCLLLDEPLSNLDARLRLHMRGQIRNLVSEIGTTAVYVTHDQTEALSMADRIAVMDRGRILQVATPEQLYERPATKFVADFVGEANFIDGRVTQAGELVKVATTLGDFSACPAGPADSVDVGDEITCCVRPERITIAPGQAGAGQGATLLAARVVSSMYLGQMRQYTCELDGGLRWKVSAVAEASPAIASGEAVTLQVEAQNVAILPT